MHDTLIENKARIYKKYSIVYEFSFFNILGLFSIIISVVLFNTKSNIFNNIYVLPLLTGILYFISLPFIRNLKDNHINILIYILYFVRNSLALLLLFFADFVNRMPIISQRQVNKAILLMILETIVVFITLYKMDRPHKKNQLNVNGRISYIFKLFLFLSTVVCIFSFLLDSSINNSYTTIFSGKIGLIESVGSREDHTIWFRIFNFIFPIIQLLLPLYIVSQIRMKMGQNNISLVLSLLLSISPLLMIGPSSAYALIATVSLLLTTINIYRRYRKLLEGIAVIGITLFLFIYIANKLPILARFNRIEYVISDFFQSYFPGITNIAGAFQINKDLISIELLRNDLITFVPMRRFIFPDWNDNFRALQLFQVATQNPNQIMANVSIAFLYTGYLAPALSAVMVNISNSFYHRKSENVLLYGVNTMISIYFAIGLVMLNITSVGARFSESFIWMLLAATLSLVKEK